MSAGSLSAEEAVEVSVIYRDGAAYPLLQAVWWRGERFNVSTIDLVYPERDGATTFLCYFVSCDRTQFRVRLNTRRQIWLACTTTA